MPRPLAVGVQLPEVERVVGWPEIRDMARAAEDVGFDAIWVGDHLLYRDEHGARGPWEAWSLLAALAAVTDRVRLGPLVAATAFHAPAMLAKKAATVDEISDGRLVLGLGAGWNEVEFRAFGFPFDHRASRFEEALGIIVALLRDGRCDFHGRFYEVEDCELLPPARPGRPPLMIGSQGPRVLRASLPHVQAWNTWHTWYGNDPGRLGPLLDNLAAAADDVGVDVDAIAKSAAVLVAMPGAIGRPSGRGEVSPPQPGTDPAYLVDLMHRYADAGIDEVQLVLDPITLDSVRALEPFLAALDR